MTRSTVKNLMQLMNSTTQRQCCSGSLSIEHVTFEFIKYLMVTYVNSDTSVHYV